MKIFLLIISLMTLYLELAASQNHNGTNLVTIQQYPYIVQFILDSEPKKTLFCSGCILTNYHIVAAAHCFHKLEDPVKEGKVFVASGSDEPLQGNFHKIIDVKSHENYADTENDIAIITLKDPIDISPTERPVSLPTQEDTVKDGSVVKVVGWDNGPNATTNTLQLMELNVNVVPKKHCDTVYRRIGLEEFVAKVYFGKSALQTMNLTVDQLNSSWVNVPYDNLVQILRDYELRDQMCVFCAGSDGISSLKGDSGGPVFQNGFLVGLSSFNVGNRGPAVFTEISKYLKWINKHIVTKKEEPKINKKLLHKNSSISKHCDSLLMLVFVLLTILFI